jgi:hypothetical protein
VVGYIAVLPPLEFEHKYQIKTFADGASEEHEHKNTNVNLRASFSKPKKII